jgi:hypothetical protein
MKRKNAEIPTVKSSVIDLCKDYLEIGIDSMLEGEIFKEIPILKTLLTVKDIGVKFRAYVYQKKVQAFLEGLRSGLGDDAQAIDGFMQGEANQQQFAETAFVFIERYDDINKPEVMGLMWAACAKRMISYEQVARICYIIDKVYWYDLLYLLNFKEGVHGAEELAVESLCSVGLLARGGIHGGTYGDTLNESNSGGFVFKRTELGDKLARFGLQKFSEAE